MTLTLRRISSSPTHSESDLVAATREGDDRAFEQLYSRYRDRIFSFILSRVNDHGRAEDIAQEVFISALRRLQKSEQRISFKPWIYEIAKNACIDEFRRGSRSREVPLETDGEFVTDRESTLSVVPTPAAAVESKQHMDDLCGAFGGLSSNHHQLLVMREFEGLSYDEIGDRLNMTRQMVESGLFRARRKLTEEYEELTSGRRCEQVQGEIEAGTVQSVRSLGLKQRRRVSRHLSHCQPCRHAAFMAGVDEALLKPRSISEKIAALLPFPLFRWAWPWRGGRGRHDAGASSSGSHHLAAGSVRKAAGLAQPASSSISLGHAAAAAAVLALAGAGGGLVHGLAGGQPHRPAGLTHSADTGAHALGSGTAGSSGSGSSSAGTGRSSAAAGTRLLPGGTSALIVSSPSFTRRPAGGERHGAGSAPGAPASGTSGSGSAASTAGSPGSALGGSGKVAGVTNAVHSTFTNATNGLKSTVTNAANGLKSTVTNTTKPVGSTVQGVVGTTQRTVASTLAGATGSDPAPAPVKSVAPAIGSTLSAVTGGPTSAGTGSSPPPASTPGLRTSSASGTPSASGTSSASGAASSVTPPLNSTVGNAASGLLGK